MGFHSEVRIERLYGIAIVLFNFFCIAPISKGPGTSLLQFNKVKITIFLIILSSAVSIELYDIISHIFGMPISRPNGTFSEEMTNDEDNEGPHNHLSSFFMTVNDVRYSYLSMHIVGITVNILVNQPRCLVRFHTYSRHLGKHLPTTLQVWQLLLFLVILLLFGSAECWLFVRFRFPGGVPGGSYLSELPQLTITLYVYVTCLASDVLFYVTAAVNHCYYQCILRNLKDHHFAFPNIKEFLHNIKEIRRKPTGVLQLRELFGVACDMKESINQAFTLQFFLLATRSFVDSTAAIFMAIQWVTRKQAHPSDNESFILSAWCGILLVKIIMMAAMAHRLKQDIEDTGIEIHRRFNNTVDLTIKFELIAFSQEVMHRKEPFNALNLFVIDYGLFTNIIGTISTYLIILLQFRQS